MNLASMNPALLKASLNPALRSSTLGLKICLIVTLTAEAELHHLAPPTHAESRQHCLNAVLKLVGIGKTFSAEDYDLLDPMLGVSISLTLLSLLCPMSDCLLDDHVGMLVVRRQHIV